MKFNENLELIARPIINWANDCKSGAIIGGVFWPQAVGGEVINYFGWDYDIVTDTWKLEKMFTRHDWRLAENYTYIEVNETPTESGKYERELTCIFTIILMAFFLSILNLICIYAV